MDVNECLKILAKHQGEQCDEHTRWAETMEGRDPSGGGGGYPGQRTEENGGGCGHHHHHSAEPGPGPDMRPHPSPNSEVAFGVLAELAFIHECDVKVPEWGVRIGMWFRLMPFHSRFSLVVPSGMRAHVGGPCPSWFALGFLPSVHFTYLSGFPLFNRSSNSMRRWPPPLVSRGCLERNLVEALARSLQNLS